MTSPKSVDNSFYEDSPRRILQKATYVAKAVDKNTELQQANRISQLKQLAQRRRQQVKQAIEVNKHQNDIFRKLEEEDEAKRTAILQKIEDKTNKICNIRDENTKKRVVSMHKVNEKVEKTLQKHVKDDERFQQNCQGKAKQLDKKMLEFHKRQLDDMQKEWRRLRGLKTCYTSADKAITAREKKKQQFALRTEKQIEENLHRNRKKENPEMFENYKRRSMKWSQAYKTSEDFYSARTNHFVQVYCGDLDTAIEMQNKKEDSFSKTTDKISKFLEKRVEKWKKLKKQVDQEAKVVPQKCINKMNQSMNSSFRATSSDFHKTCHTWMTKNSRRKSELKRLQNIRDDRILSRHLDNSRQLQDQSQLNNTMTDMMLKAGFQARQFL